MCVHERIVRRNPRAAVRRPSSFGVASCYVYWRYTGQKYTQDTFSIRTGGFTFLFSWTLRRRRHPLRPNENVVRDASLIYTYVVLLRRSSGTACSRPIAIFGWKSLERKKKKQSEGAKRKQRGWLYSHWTSWSGKYIRMPVSLLLLFGKTSL